MSAVFIGCSFAVAMATSVQRRLSAIGARNGLASLKAFVTSANFAVKSP
jgi:hypothetical protein